MKKRNLLLGGLAAGAAVLGATKGSLLRALYDLEKPQADLFTKMEDNGNIVYVCKNNAKSEGMLKDWIEYNGWQQADQIGEGYFYINDAEETLLLNRDVCRSGRYLFWRASRSIEG